MDYRWRPAVLLILTLWGCAGAAPSAGGNRAGGGFRLPAPAEIAGRAASAYTPQRNGSQNEATPLSRISDAAGSATFAPQWGGANTQLGDAAYAVYRFELPDYNAPEVLHLSWSAPPSSGELYIGVSDFDANHWSWQQPADVSSMPLGDPRLARSRQDGSDIVLVALVLLGVQPATLDSLQWGGGAAPADITFSIDTSRDVHAISPLIYGMNQADWTATPNLTLTRLGGNRWTAYNWENNASNAGMDWFNQNDGYLSDSDTPGEAARAPISEAFAHSASVVVTVPIQGYVAADKLPDGDVADSGPDYLQTRFKPSLAQKGSAFTLTPDASDGFVYQDEYVNWLSATFPPEVGGPQVGVPRLLYSLDNEPDLWASTHPRIQTEALTYAALAARSAEFASAIKDVDPAGMVLGPVSYGWYGYETLQDAPDAVAEGNFLDYYLDAMQAVGTTAGKRLLDVLDLHWYSEAQGGGVRITGEETTPNVVQARIQAPRSLWDPTYTEASWIAEFSTLGPIRLIPRMKEKIAAHYPGTLLSITEYNYGAGGHISGGIAQADTLGILGREDVYAACEWNLSADNSYIHSAFNMFRDYDGAGGSFLSTSVHADSSDIARATVYASTDMAGKMVLVAINKTDAPLDAAFVLESGQSFASAGAWELTGSGSVPLAATGPALQSAPTFRYTLPAMSVVTLELN